MKKKMMIKFTTGYNWQYNLKHPWEFVFQFYYTMRDFIQRGLYGYADTDTWNLDWYLSTLLSSAIQKIYDDGVIGFPHGLTEKRWNVILLKIVKGFEADLKIDEDCKAINKTIKRWEKERKEGLELFIKYYNNLWD